MSVAIGDETLRAARHTLISLDGFQEKTEKSAESARMALVNFFEFFFNATMKVNYCIGKSCIHRQNHKKCRRYLEESRGRSRGIL